VELLRISLIEIGRGMMDRVLEIESGDLELIGRIMISGIEIEVLGLLGPERGV